MTGPSHEARRGRCSSRPGRLGRRGASRSSSRPSPRVRRPASARIGDRGIVTADGGSSAGSAAPARSRRSSARRFARSRREDPPASHLPAGRLRGGEGVVVAESSCASEGMVEVLIEPQLPAAAPRGRRRQPGGGDAPRSRRARSAGASRPTSPRAPRPSWSPRWAAATRRRSTPRSRLRRGYVGLVASAKRAGVELAALRERGLDEETLARVRSPAGLDLGPLSQQEIAVAVLAELVAWRHARAQCPASSRSRRSTRCAG